MDNPVTMALLRVYFNEGDRFDGHPLADYLLDQARGALLAGATVLRGVMGFGSHRAIHTTTLLRLAEHLPLVLEVVDERERILAFVEQRGEALAPTLVTVETVEVLHSPRKS